MKKKLNYLFVLVMLTCASPVLATSIEVTEPSTTITESARSVVLTERLKQIHEMDKSSLSLEEKRALRREVKEIKREESGGVTMSVGAIIIILLLLIILL